MNLSITPMTPNDWEAVRTIYREGIVTGNATFETQVPPWEIWDAAHHSFSRLVARIGTDVVGWAALMPVSKRECYRGVADLSIYIASHARGQGVGKRLLPALIQSSEENGIWTLQAGIFVENTASIRLHQHCGFRLVGKRERIGQLAGRWRDVLLLERRSPVV